jgi:hypothetical protein
MRINMPKHLFDSLGHIDAECLDMYCAGRLAEADRLALRRHLAVCDECREQERLERSVSRVILSHQDVLASPPAQAVAPQPRWLPLRWGPVAAVAASLLLVVATSSWSTSVQPVDVPLQAMRGSLPQPAPSGSPLRLRLDQTGLPDDGPRSPGVDVVDAQGRLLLTGSGRLQSGSSVFETGRSLAVGHYWVRLRYGAKLVREYELVVE